MSDTKRDQPAQFPETILLPNQIDGEDCAIPCARANGITCGIFSDEEEGNFPIITLTSDGEVGLFRPMTADDARAVGRVLLQIADDIEAMENPS